MQWWVESWLPDFFRNAAESDLLGLFKADHYTLERVEAMLDGAPYHLYHQFKVNRFRFAWQLYYDALPQELYNRLLSLLAVRELMIAQEGEKDAAAAVDAALVVKALKMCSAYIWGNAAYAVAFCVCRDLYGWQDNGRQFEIKMEEQGVDCPNGTIASTFYNNKYMKMHVDKWKNAKVPKRVMVLKDELKNCINELASVTKP
jgi:hypothetical protein